MGLGCLLEAARILPSMVAVEGISRGFQGGSRGFAEARRRMFSKVEERLRESRKKAGAE